jgi:hypothetical protein
MELTAGMQFQKLRGRRGGFKCAQVRSFQTAEPVKEGPSLARRRCDDEGRPDELADTQDVSPRARHRLCGRSPDLLTRQMEAEDVNGESGRLRRETRPPRRDWPVSARRRCEPLQAVVRR